MRCREADFDYEIFNLGRSDTVELADLIRKLERALEKRATIVSKPNQPGDVDQTFADISKARQMLGYEPKVSIDEGLERFAAWFRRDDSEK